jgi:outer membrane protein
MKKSLLLSSLVLLITIGFYTPEQVQAQAQDLKIGYVDPNTLLMRMPEMAAVERRLQNFAERKRREFREKQETLQRDSESLEQRRAVISADAVTREEQRLTTLYTELQQFESTYTTELQQQQAELLGPLLEKVQDAINSVAAELGLTYVLNTMTNSGDFIILYASPAMQRQYDITERVAAKLEL